MNIAVRQRATRLLRGALVVLVAIIGLSGCVPWYTGSPASFYDLPADATPRAPGILVRVQEMTAQSTSTTTVYRVMYWTKDRLDRPVRATGVARVPKAAAPERGTPIGAWDHGTSGVAPQCAPSRTGAGYPTAFLPEHVPVAIPDYIGLGPHGEMHAWLAGVSEARATIDLVRAIRWLPNVRSDGTWYVAGHSQGGHAALFSAQEVEDYAPELRLMGVVAIAPGTELNRPDYVVNHMKPAAVMVGFGLDLDYPELELRDYLTPEAESKLGVLETGCINEIIATFLPITPLVDSSPFNDPRFVELLVENEPGHAPAGVPVLVLQGANDIIVPASYTQDYVERACAQGDRVKLSVYPNADHNTIVGQAAAEAREWIVRRAFGQVAPTSC
jgi:pimeloyl-ACP methyl ester carboxylesterase